VNGQGGINLAWLQQQFPDLSNLNALSSGGQKHVFSATHPQDGDDVLKIIHARQHTEATQREVLAVNQLAAARVPRILQTGAVATNTGNVLWLRETRINGPTLRQKLQAGALAPREVLLLGRQLLETLLEAEKCRIVHRDVKPENIICDSNGDFWLIDFGLARHLDLHSLTATVNVFGKFTPGYAPREQYRNVKGDIDARCDLFATGVTLYEAATGQNPYVVGARDFQEVFRRVETVPLPRLLIPIAQQAAFADLVSAMTQRRRDHRPSSIVEAHAWMKQICDAEGV
jgi:serine/threonine protein kinase